MIGPLADGPQQFTACVIPGTAALIGSRSNEILGISEHGPRFVASLTNMHRPRPERELLDRDGRRPDLVGLVHERLGGFEVVGEGGEHRSDGAGEPALVGQTGGGREVVHLGDQIPRAVDVGVLDGRLERPHQGSEPGDRIADRATASAIAVCVAARRSS